MNFSHSSIGTAGADDWVSLFLLKKEILKNAAPQSQNHYIPVGVFNDERSTWFTDLALCSLWAADVRNGICWLNNKHSCITCYRPPQDSWVGNRLKRTVYGHVNLSSSLSYPCCLLRLLFQLNRTLTQSPLVDDALYSHHKCAWQCINVEQAGRENNDMCGLGVFFKDLVTRQQNRACWDWWRWWPPRLVVSPAHKHNPTSAVEVRR